MDGNVQLGLDEGKLKHRNVPTQTNSVDEARTAVLKLNAQEEKDGKDDRDRKTFGRTPDGTGRTSRKDDEPRSHGETTTFDGMPPRRRKACGIRVS